MQLFQGLKFSHVIFFTFGLSFILVGGLAFANNSDEEDNDGKPIYVEVPCPDVIIIISDQSKFEN